MQLLYISETMYDGNSPKNARIELRKAIDKSRSLLAFLLHNAIQIAKYSEVWAYSRANKNIVTEEDRNVNTKVAGNEVVWKLLENKSYQKLIEEEKPELITDKADNEYIKKFFLELLETDIYKSYISEDGRIKKDEINILSIIFNDLMLQNENFISLCEELFSNWDDDIEMLQQIILSIFQKPDKYNIDLLISDSKWQFAISLLETVIDKKEHLMSLIVPKLKNWEADRIALVDMIFIKMGIAELLYFDTIPTRVTLNEYIDLAKEYSSKQSSQFINGIMDAIHKELLAEGKIQKVSFVKK